MSTVPLKLHSFTPEVKFPGANTHKKKNYSRPALSIPYGTNENQNMDNIDSKSIPITTKPAVEEKRLTGREVEDYAVKSCVETHSSFLKNDKKIVINKRWQGDILEESYKRCSYITSIYAKTFYMGTKLMTKDKAKATWAIYVWCRRTDELVDGPNASKLTPLAIDRWEERLEAIFDGRPYDILDAALADTIMKYGVDIQPFKDMIDGMRMDLVKYRYANFDELYEYCYRVAGTVGLMTTPIMGIQKSYDGNIEEVYKAALALGTANQLTNILRDVGEDLYERNRIYIPISDLEKFDISESDLTQNKLINNETGEVDQRWKSFMKMQIKRAREYFSQSEKGIEALGKDAQWPVWSSLILYRQILDQIEKNDYNNFSKRAYVSKAKKLASLPAAFVKSLMPYKK